MTIPEIFAQKGEPYFRDLEAQYIRNFRGRTIVATGGGAILRDETAEFARKQGVVIFLNHIYPFVFLCLFASSSTSFMISPAIILSDAFAFTSKVLFFL